MLAILAALVALFAVEHANGIGGNVTGAGNGLKVPPQSVVCYICYLNHCHRLKHIIVYRSPFLRSPWDKRDFPKRLGATQPYWQRSALLSNIL